MSLDGHKQSIHDSILQCPHEYIGFDGVCAG